MTPVLLIVLDGWGIAPRGPGNAIYRSNLPFYNSLMTKFPHGTLTASGEAVGLPKGEDGNTETGHINLGAGYIVYQDLPRINLSIADGSFFRNQAFIQAIDHARKYESNIHLLGLIGSGGVHSNTEHLLALLQLMKEHNFKRVYLHLFTDGRDSPPKSALLYVKNLQSYLDSLEVGTIATVIGRYFAMDRDHRWERTKRAYEALTHSVGNRAKTVEDAISISYDKGITDEFIEPTVLVKNNQAIAQIKANDSVIFFNYRVDRPRQLTKAFVLENFEKDGNIVDFDPYLVKYFKKHEAQLSQLSSPFARGPRMPHLYFVTMTEYSRFVHASAVAFPPHIVAHPLGECIAEMGLSQLHMAESEKERFVTYYFNGQREAPFAGQETVIVPSPKVATYDLSPSMSSVDLTDTLLHLIDKKLYDFTLVNFACPDMVAHTGNIEATIVACETVDTCLSRIVPQILNMEGIVCITGDHGNAEELIDPLTGGIDTEHSTFPVPFLVLAKKWEGKPVELSPGVLADVAPTILSIMDIKKPSSMTGRNLLENSLD